MCSLHFFSVFFALFFTIVKHQDGKCSINKCIIIVVVAVTIIITGVLNSPFVPVVV